MISLLEMLPNIRSLEKIDHSWAETSYPLLHPPSIASPNRTPMMEKPKEDNRNYLLHYSYPGLVLYSSLLPERYLSICHPWSIPFHPLALLPSAFLLQLLHLDLLCHKISLLQSLGRAMNPQWDCLLMTNNNWKMMMMER